MKYYCDVSVMYHIPNSILLSCLRYYNSTYTLYEYIGKMYTNYTEP